MAVLFLLFPPLCFLLCGSAFSLFSLSRYDLFCCVKATLSPNQINKKYFQINTGRPNCATRVVWMKRISRNYWSLALRSTPIHFLICVCCILTKLIKFRILDSITKMSMNYLVNFPFICSNSKIIPKSKLSQLIRYDRDCSSCGDFINRGSLLTNKLVDQEILQHDHSPHTVFMWTSPLLTCVVYSWYPTLYTHMTGDTFKDYTVGAWSQQKKFTLHRHIYTLGFFDDPCCLWRHFYFISTLAEHYYLKLPYR